MIKQFDTVADLHHASSFSLKEKEQAEVGLRPTLLAPRCALGL